jgi:hypothetical protein
VTIAGPADNDASAGDTPGTGPRIATPSVKLAAYTPHFTAGLKTTTDARSAAWLIRRNAQASTTNANRPVPRVGSIVMNTPIEKLPAVSRTVCSSTNDR